MEKLDATSKKRKLVEYTIPTTPSAPEVKCNDVQVTVALDNDKMNGFQAAGLLNALGAGIGANQRLGRVVKPRALWLNYCMYRPALTETTTTSQVAFPPGDNIYKVSIVWDKQAQGFAPGNGSTVATWYSSVTVYKNQNGFATNVIAQPNIDWRDRMIVLWEGTTHTWTRFDSAPKYGQVRLDLEGLRQIFNGGNNVDERDILEGACYFVVQCLRTSSSATGDRLDYVARYFFEDN